MIKFQVLGENMCVCWDKNVVCGFNVHVNNCKAGIGWEEHPLFLFSINFWSYYRRFDLPTHFAPLRWLFIEIKKRRDVSNMYTERFLKIIPKGYETVAQKAPP